MAQAEESTPQVSEAGSPSGKGVAEIAKTPADQGWFNWTDDSISFLPYGGGFEVDPGEQSTFTFEHVQNSKIGDLFFFSDLTYFHDSGVSDDSTWYAEISPRLSLGKVFDTDLSWTPIRPSLFAVKDVLIATQYERGSNPDEAQAALVGIGFDLDARDIGFEGPLSKFDYVQLNVYVRT